MREIRESGKGAGTDGSARQQHGERGGREELRREEAESRVRLWFESVRGSRLKSTQHGTGSERCDDAGSIGEREMRVGEERGRGEAATAGGPSQPAGHRMWRRAVRDQHATRVPAQRQARCSRARHGACVPGLARGLNPEEPSWGPDTGPAPRSAPQLHRSRATEPRRRACACARSRASRPRASCSPGRPIRRGPTAAPPAAAASEREASTRASLSISYAARSAVGMPPRPAQPAAALWAIVGALRPQLGVFRASLLSARLQRERGSAASTASGGAHYALRSP
jgi:hypothetical protein